MFGRYLATARNGVRAATTPLTSSITAAAAAVVPVVVRRTIPAAVATSQLPSTTSSATATAIWRVRHLHAATSSSSIPTTRSRRTSSSISSSLISSNPMANPIIMSTLRAMISRRSISKVAISPAEFQRLQALERDADGHPSSEAMQVRFYKALLRPMPGIIVQRYESGNFAGGSEAEVLYDLAVAKVEEQTTADEGTSSTQRTFSQSHPTPTYPSHHTPMPSYGTPSSSAAASSYGTSYGGYGMPPPPAPPAYGYGAPPQPSWGAPPAYGYGAPQYSAPPPSPPQQQEYHNDDQRPELGSESRPLYMQPVPDKWARFVEGARIAMSVAFMYYIYTLVYPEEKGEGGGLPGLPGAAAGKAHREADVSQTTTRFTDVKGCDEAKHELQEIVEFLRNPEKFTKLGAKLPRGVLLVGPPGTGKTLLAKAIAGEAGVPFFFASGSEFDEMYVGVGASRIKKLFAQARKKSPCIIFIDELDAIGGRRNPRDSTHSRQAINQLLVELDGFDTNDKVIIIGATNLAGVLDKALLRPGRFDRTVEVPLPDIKGRKEILELYGKKVPLAADANLLQLARGTPGSSGADLFNLINSAALRAAQLNAKQVTTHHLEWARDKILMGAERKSNLLTDAVRKKTAYHEGGHAIVMLKTPGADPIHKATIMPRGNALGMVQPLAETDEVSQDRQQYIAWIDICMGGRVAEELIFGVDHITSGASNDLLQATTVARNMVLRWGFGSSTGLSSIRDEDLPIQSEETRQKIDSEVKQILDASYSRAKTMLQANEAGLHRLAAALMKHETLDAREIKIVLAGGTIDDSRFSTIELDERAQRNAERDAEEKSRAQAKAAEAAAQLAAGKSAPPSSANGPSSSTPPTNKPSNSGSGGTVIPMPSPTPVAVAGTKPGGIIPVPVATPSPAKANTTSPSR